MGVMAMMDLQCDYSKTILHFSTDIIYIDRKIVNSYF